MARLRAPDGSETIDVEDPAEIRHYMDLGATIVPLLPSEAPDKYSGPTSVYPGEEEAPIENAPWYADPVELAAGALVGPAQAGMRALTGAGRAAVGAGASAIGSAASRVGKGAAGTIGDVAGQTLLEMGLDFLPAPLRGGARVALKRLGGGATKEAAESGTEKVGSAASRVRKPAPKPEPKPEPKLASEKEIGKRVKVMERYERRAAKMENPKPAPKTKAPSKIAGEIKPAPKGSAESRVIAKPRHDVQYFSKSQGKHINIEDMNQKHIEQAYRSLAATNPKPGSVARRQMDALLEESKYRLQTTGIHIGQAS